MGHVALTGAFLLYIIVSKLLLSMTDALKTSCKNNEIIRVHVILLTFF